VRLDSGPIVAHLAVCNLHVGTCHVLPPLSSRYLIDDVHDVNCYAMLTAADYRLDDDHDKSTALPHGAMAFCSDVVVRGGGGSAHWFFGNWIARRSYIVSINT
jgi:hypothetical protein